MRSLRARLGLFVSVVALSLTLVAGGLVAALRWQEQDNRLEDVVALAAFQLADTASADGIRVEVHGGERPFAVLYGNPPDVLASEGEVSDELARLLVEEIWQFTAQDDNAVSADFTDLGVVAAGAQCADTALCDTAVVGAHREAFISYLLRHWLWLFAVPSMVGLAVLASTRWLIGRSLQPVEAMRAQLDDITTTDLDRRLAMPLVDDELADLGRSMNATIGRLGEAVSANEQFVADAAHELRSPITGVRAALEVEASRSESGLIEDSLGELDRASRLIDDLLTLARRQGRPAPRSEVDLDDVAHQQMTAAAARFPDVELGRHLAPVRLEANPDDLSRIVANLVDNACQHCDKRVDVELAVVDDRARLVVTDDGPGIPPDQREIVFERFARLDESRSRQTGGAGLGLAIVRELVLSIGGQVIIEDGALGGASVRVELPIDST